MILPQFSIFFKFKQDNSFFKLIKIIFVFLCITFALIVFRSDNLTDAIFFINKIFEFKNLFDGASVHKFYIFKRKNSFIKNFQNKDFSQS